MEKKKKEPITTRFVHIKQTNHTYAYNTVTGDLDNEYLASYIVENGLTVHIESSLKSMQGPAEVHCKSFKITVPVDAAVILLNLLSRREYAIIDLKTTELFNNPHIWESLDWAGNSQKRMYLILNRSGSNLEKKLKNRPLKKKNLTIAGVVLFVILIGLPIMVSGTAMKTFKATHNWKSIFDLEESDLTQDSIIRGSL